MTGSTRGQLLRRLVTLGPRVLLCADGRIPDHRLPREIGDTSVHPRPVLSTA